MRRTSSFVKLPHAEVVRRLLAEHPEDVTGVIVVQSAAGEERVVAWGPGCVDPTETAALIRLPVGDLPLVAWAPPEGSAEACALAAAAAKVARPGSHTRRALALLASHPGMTIAAASREAAAAPSAVTKGLSRARSRLRQGAA